MRRASQPLVFNSALGNVIFQTEVLRTFARFQQTNKANPEAGGQLFAFFAPGKINVSLATGPTSKAERGRYFFRPNRKEEQMEIAEAFRKGLHFVGDWHTHPESEPTPSGADIAKAKGIFEKSSHELSGLLIVIVGTAEPPRGIWAGWITDAGISRICMEETGSTSRKPSS